MINRLSACSISVGVLALLGACAVGPEFERPAAPAAAALPPVASATVGIAGSSGAVQRFKDGMDIPAQWWTLYQSPALNALIERALSANADLAAAQAALRAAHENRLSGYGVFMPSIQGSFAASRQKDPTGTVSPTSASGNPYLTLFTPQLSVSYTLDVLGGARRGQENLDALEQAQRFQTEAAYLTLTTNVVTAAVGEAALQGQIEATEQIIAAETELLAISRRQLALGEIAEADVVAQEAALAQAEQTLPPLTKQLDQQRDQLAALLGQLPGDMPSETFQLTDLHLPEELPAALPAKLVEQRPDIRMAEANLQAASAEVGVAIANRLPNISLSGAWGGSSNQFGNLMTPGNEFWNIGAGLTQPLFDGFALLHKERAARANLDQAAAQYRSTVVTAFQNVADSLLALQEDAQTLRAAAIAEQAANRSLAIAKRQLDLGDIPYTSVLNAEQTALQAGMTRVQAQAGRLIDTAALFQALGGGWWNKAGAPAEQQK